MAFRLVPKNRLARDGLNSFREEGDSGGKSNRPLDCFENTRVFTMEAGSGLVCWRTASFTGTESREGRRSNASSGSEPLQRFPAGKTSSRVSLTRLAD